VPASNLATNRLRPDQHPIGSLYRADFNVTLSTDNRLMSSTSMSEELETELSQDGIASGYAAAGATVDPVRSRG
jgi:adenosine deaminase